ncbi:MAG: Rossmann-like and DUF2520 domain-containing protein [Ignavibacteriaceae bacterium]
MPDIKPNIAIIGAGKIAFSLTNSLIHSGYKVAIVISKNISSAKKLAGKFQIKPYSDKFQDLPSNCNIFFLCVPDSQLKSVSMQLSEIKLNFPRSLFIQLSGALTTSDLTSLQKKKAMTASFHIMQTFPSKKIISLSKSYAAIETQNDRAEKFLFRLAKKLDLIPFKLESRNKIFYHLAGVYVSNFLVGNIFSSQKLFDRTKSKRINFSNLIMPIVSTTISNVKKFGAEKSLSGPVERGDLQIIKNHISSLKKISNPSEINIEALNYISQSLSLLTLVKQKNLKLNDRQFQIQKLLLEELKSISANI